MDRRHYLTGAVVAVLVLAAFTYLGSGAMIAAVNDATRADLSKHVSNRTCSGDDACPGVLRCYGGSYDPDPEKRHFDADRVGANISGPRCVTPTYVERHCGIFEYWNGRSDGGVHYLGPCFPSGQRHSYGPIDYATRVLTADDLFDRIFNTDRNGTERIRSHNLQLATEDSDAG